jgi:hypothetical protein
MCAMTDDLEARVAAIEARLGMEAGLRAAGDRDLAALGQTVRAQHHLIQALSITQSAHTDSLARLTEAVDSIRSEHGAKLDRIVAMPDRLLDQQS